MSLPARTLLLLTLFLAFGCSATKDATEGEVPAQPETHLEVENRNFNDMNIYVLRGGQRHRLGSITGGHTEVFVIPTFMVLSGGSLSFLADPIGGARTPVTQEMSIFPGDTVRLVIPAF